MKRTREVLMVRERGGPRVPAVSWTKGQAIRFIQIPRRAGDHRERTNHEEAYNLDGAARIRRRNFSAVCAVRKSATTITSLATTCFAMRKKLAGRMSNDEQVNRLAALAVKL